MASLHFPHSFLTCAALLAAQLLAAQMLVALTLAAPTAGAQQPAAVSTLTTPASAPELSVPPAQLTPQQIGTMQAKLADWPQLARYRGEDLQLGEPARGERRVVFFGDSITDFWGRGRGRFFPGEPWVNRGISGQTTPQMALRLHQDVLALHPEAVVILAGINDIAGNTGAESIGVIEENFRTMVTLAKAAHVRVVLSSVLPAARFPWHPGIDPRDEVTALNQWLQGYARAQGCVYLDYYPALAGPDGGMRPELASDGIHPTDAGYAVMEPLARAAVLRALAGPRP